MPNNTGVQTVYTQEVNLEQMAVPSLYAAGQLGARVTVHVPLRNQPGVGPVPETGASKSYQLVQSDSSATQNITRGMGLYWKDRAKKVVSPEVGGGGVGDAAGVAKCAVPKGNFFWMQYKGPSIVQGAIAFTGTIALNKFVVGRAAEPGKLDVVDSAPAHPHFGFVAGALDATNRTFLAMLDVPEVT